MGVPVTVRAQVGAFALVWEAYVHAGADSRTPRSEPQEPWIAGFKALEQRIIDVQVPCVVLRMRLLAPGLHVYQHSVAVLVTDVIEHFADVAVISTADDEAVFAGRPGGVVVNDQTAAVVVREVVSPVLIGHV